MNKKIIEAVEKTESIKDFTPEPFSFDEVPKEAPVIEEPMIEESIAETPKEAPKEVPDNKEEKAGEEKADEEKAGEFDDILGSIDTEVKDDSDFLEKRKAANSALREKLKESNSSLKSISAEKLLMEEEFEKLKASYEAIRKTSTDLNDHPEIREISSKWDSKLDTLADEISMAGLSGEKLKSMAPNLIQQMQQATDSDKREEIVEMIDENFPDYKKEVIHLIADGAKNFSLIQEKMGEISQREDTDRSQVELDEYDERINLYNEAEKDYFNPPQDLIEEDPMHTKVILKNLIDSDEKVKDRADKVKKLIRSAMTPSKPVTQEEIEGMDIATAREYAGARVRRSNEAKKAVGKIMAEATLAYSVIPMFYKKISDLEETIQALSGSSPKIGGSDGEEIATGEKTSLKDYVPPVFEY